MKPGIRVCAIVVLLLAAVACSREQPAEPPEVPPSAAPTEVAPDPATPPLPMEDEPAPAPSDDTVPAGTDTVTGFHGFGPARFGDDPESVRIAWGRPLSFSPEPSADAPCGYLVPDPAPSDEFAIAFMFDGDRFVRYDVRGEQYEAPGSARIGNHREALEAFYGDRHQLLPHKYVEGGQYFSVDGPEGSGSKLVFELDAEGIVTAWRIGLPPQVDYVEGCS